MCPVSLIFTVLATYFCFANGQSECPSPDDGCVLCKSIYECPSLLKILEKSFKTDQDIEMLRNFSQCGGESEKVCCPFQCCTPDGRPGKCTTVGNCPHLANLLKRNISENNLLFNQNSTCPRTEKHSVCCALSLAAGSCAATVSAFPPQPWTECCGVDSKVGDKILGGNETSLEQYPWLVLIEYKSDSQPDNIVSKCGGALISGQYVLTAAHCVVGKVLETVGEPVIVRLGEYDMVNSGKDCVPVAGGGTDCTSGIIQIPIEKIIAHPDYKTMKHSPHDIALIRLLKSAPFTDFIRPICLPTVDVTASPPDNFFLFTAGWGATTANVSSNLKMHVDLPFVERDECLRIHSGITSGHICAGGVLGKDSCSGDSGGPLMYENIKTYEVIGVVSYGPSRCGRADIPSVYTKVFEYLPWIKQNIVK